MHRIAARKRTILAAGVIASVIVGVAAYAYFTSTGSGESRATVGSSTAFTVTFGTASGTVYPGSGTTTLPYTVANPSTGNQRLATTTASVAADANGDVTAAGTAVTGCKASWFTATNTAPAAATLAPAATTTGSVALTMQESNTNQDACQGARPDVKVNAS